MNFTPTFGWYYTNINDRAPAWTGVDELYNFLTKNQGPGPFASAVDVSKMQLGDVIQLSFAEEKFSHSMVVVETGKIPSLETILIATHSNDADCRPILTYAYEDIRFLHIEGVRKIEPVAFPFGRFGRSAN